MTFVAKLYLKITSFLRNAFHENRMVFVVSAFIMLTGNWAFFNRLLKIYPPVPENIGLLISIALFFSLATVMLLTLLSHGRAARWVLAFYLIAAAMAGYYMDNFGVIIDTVMFDNIRQTDAKEVAGLLNWGMFSRLIFLGLVPAGLVLRFSPKPNPRFTYRARFGFGLLMVCVLVMLMAPFTAGYANFIREHKTTRLYANPTFFSYSLVKYLSLQLSAKEVKTLTKVAEDAKSIDPVSKNELIILVVGETARADRFSLNGYKRDTNPRLSQMDVISLKNVSSCGTSTSVSVPCMFSILGRDKYEKEKALHMENALDVLADHGIEVLWRDNNSDSKGVATRIQYEDFKSPTLNPECHGECRDIGMLNGLDRYIASKPGKDILIVLHQMGNHGPEYYRRYPEEFAKFKPICMTGDIRKCTQEEVDNSYDNAILYTDYFLSEVIKFLQKYENDRETAMLYVADHGESLGEHGFYLHAAPYLIAPEEQTHVPAILWFGKHFDYSMEQVKPYADFPLSHDDLFCSILVAYELESGACNAKNKWLYENLDIKAARMKIGPISQNDHA